MFKYAVNKHGKEKCALVSTVAMRKAKTAIKDTIRILNLDTELGEEIAKLIPVTYYDDNGDKETDLSIDDSLKVIPELKEYQKKYPRVFEIAMKLENLPRASSIHAAGTLIGTRNLNYYLPLRRVSEDSYINATALTLKDAEKASSIKFDFLALNTLDVIDKVEKDTGFVFDYEDEELFKDEEVWDIIGSRNTTTLFQIGSKTYKDRMYRLKPKTIDELAACLALVRGPCIAEKLDEKYMQIIEGKQEVELIHPIYDEITKDTYGILIYQEQIMMLFHQLGYSMSKSMTYMKYLAKKKVDEIKKVKLEYDKLTAKIMSKKISERIWNIIEVQSLYSFNRSHAVAYAYISYITAYYRIHYPVYWMASALTNAYEKDKDITETIQECRRIGIHFNKFNCNTSQWSFEVNPSLKNTINIGLCAIKGFGYKAYESLNSNRPYVSFEDLIERVPKKEINKARFLVSIFADLYNCFDLTPMQAYEKYFSIRKDKELPTEIKVGKEKLNIDKPIEELEAFILTEALIHSPINNFEPIYFNSYRNNSIIEFKAIISKVKKIKDKNEKQMAFLTLETGDGIIDSIVFSNNYKDFTKYYKKGLEVNIKLKKTKSDGGIILNINKEEAV